MEEKREPEGLMISVKEGVELARRTFGLSAGVLGLSYVFGFIIVNTNLLKYGVYEFSLIRARYVAAGLLFVFLITLPLSLSLVFHRWFSVTWTKREQELAEERETMERIYQRERKIEELKEYDLVHFGKLSKEPLMLYFRGCFGSVLFPFLLLIFPLSYLLSYRMIVWYQAARILAGIGVMFAFLGFLAFFLPLTYHPLKAALEKKSFDTTIVMFYFSFCFISLVALAVFYGHAAYPWIPPSLGGGSPSIIQLMGSEDQIESLSHLGIDKENARLTQEIELLDRTDAMYIVLVTNRYGQKEAVEVGKDLVQGVLHPAVLSRVPVSTPTVPLPSGTSPITTATPISTLTPNR